MQVRYAAAVPAGARQGVRTRGTASRPECVRSCRGPRAGRGIAKPLFGEIIGVCAGKRLNATQKPPRGDILFSGRGAWRRVGCERDVRLGSEREWAKDSVQNRPQPVRQAHTLLQRQRVVHLLRTVGPLARVELANRLGLPRPTITAIVAELVEAGTLIELESRPEGVCNRGRPRTLLVCNPRSRRVLGIRIERLVASVVVADESGYVSKQSQTPTWQRPPEAVIASIVRIAEQLMSDAANAPVAAVGVCVSGFIDGDTGVVVESDELGWSDVAVGESLSQALGVPVNVQDSTQAITLAEAIAGEARDGRSAVVLDCGAHFGVGLIIDGRPYVGATGVAGVIERHSVMGDLAVPDVFGAGESASADGVLSSARSADTAVSKAGRSSGQPQEADAYIERIAHVAMLAEALIDPQLLILSGPIVGFNALAGALESRIDELRPSVRKARTATVRSRIIGDSQLSVMVALQKLDPDIGGLLRSRSL